MPARRTRDSLTRGRGSAGSAPPRAYRQVRVTGLLFATLGPDLEHVVACFDLNVLVGIDPGHLGTDHDGVTIAKPFDPMFANHGSYDIEEWCKELVHRTTPSHEAHARVEWRAGHPAHTILAVERELDPDLVVLAWAGNLSHGRAAVVKRLLAHATTPLMLVPVVGAATPDLRKSSEGVRSQARAG